jgi:hypothetical protein
MSVRREIDEERLGKMPELTDLVLALLHAVAAPCHRRPILAPAPQQPPPSTAPHRYVLERPCPLPLPLTGQLIDRWSPRFPTPLHGVTGGGRCNPVGEVDARH